mgnify:FL=1
MKVIMRILGVGASAVGFDGADGQYVRSYDPDGNDGRGDLEITSDPASALVFEDVKQALAAWKAQSAARPLRWDGKPNRPLSAFTVTFEPAPGENPKGGDA